MTNSVAHAMQDAIERVAAHQPTIHSLPKVNAFAFDLMESVTGVTSEPMREALLTKLAFSCDGLINARLGTLLTQFYRDQQEKIDIELPWATYQQFLHHQAGIEYNEEIMRDMGLNKSSTRQNLQHLYSLRMECHRLLADGKFAYDTPSLEAFIASPRLRRPSGETRIKWADLAKDEANGDKALEQELLAVYEHKALITAHDALSWDKRRADVLVLMLRAMQLTDVEHMVAYDGEFDPFDKLDATLQLKLLEGARRSYDAFIKVAAEDRRVSTTEFAKYRAEGKAYKAALDQAVKHPKFEPLRMQ